MNRAKVLIPLVLLLVCVNAFARLPLSTVTQADTLTGRKGGSSHLIGIVMSITVGPIEGQWVVLFVNDHRVLVWFKDVHDFEIGTKIHVLGTYDGARNYPTEGEISVYTGWYWGRLSESD